MIEFKIMVTEKKLSGKTAYRLPLLLAAVLLVVFVFTDRWVSRHTVGFDAFRKMFVLISVLLVLLIVASYYLLLVRRVRLELAFPLVGLFFGITFSLLIPPIAAPDETYHLGFVYEVAERLEGWDTMVYLKDGTVGTEFFREIEQNHGLQEIDINHEYYNEVFSRLLEKEETDALVEVKYSNNHEVPHILYLPAALGINLGRTLHLGAVPTFYLGRFFNLLVFLAAMTYALYRMPLGKELLFLIGLFPMTLQEVNSFSCDSMIFSMTFLATALIFHFAYEDVTWQSENGRLRVIPLVDLALLFAATYLLSRCKYGACVPVCLLLILVILRKWKEHQPLALTASAILIVDLLAGFLPSLYKTFHSVVLDNAAAPNYTVGDVLLHPFHTFTVLGNTIHGYMDHYIFSMVGTSLGWYNLILPRFFGLLFLALIAALLIRGAESRRITRSSERWIVGICCFLGVVTAVGGMFIGNTPKTSEEVIGVQGRYFLPYLLPFLLLLIPKRVLLLTDEETHTRSVLLTALVVLFCFVMNLFLRAF